MSNQPRYVRQNCIVQTMYDTLVIQLFVTTVFCFYATNVTLRTMLITRKPVSAHQHSNRNAYNQGNVNTVRQSVIFFGYYRWFQFSSACVKVTRVIESVSVDISFELVVKDRIVGFTL